MAMEELSPNSVISGMLSKSGTQNSGKSVKVEGSGCVGELEAKGKLLASTLGGEKEDDTRSAVGEAKAMDGERQYMLLPDGELVEFDEESRRVWLRRRS